MTSREFAEMIGVSQPSVSRALNGEIGLSEEKRKYILEKAAEYGFVLNSQARSLKIHRTQTIGVIFPQHFDSLSKNLMFTFLYDSLQKELIKYNYDIMIIGSNKDGEQPMDALERIVRSGKIDGIINFRSGLTENQIDLIHNCKIPFVSLHTGLQKKEKLHQILLDDFHVGYEVGMFFSKFPDRRNVYLGVTEKNGVKPLRLQGFEKALKETGKPLPSEDLFSCDLSMTAGEDAVNKNKEYFMGKAINMFVYNDLIAVGAVNAMLNIGIQIPGQVQIVGLDDIPLASWLHPQLTTMRPPISEMVKYACQLLINLTEKDIKPEIRYYQAELIQRETTLILSN